MQRIGAVYTYHQAMLRSLCRYIAQGLTRICFKMLRNPKVQDERDEKISSTFFFIKTDITSNAESARMTVNIQRILGHNGVPAVKTKRLRYIHLTFWRLGVGV